MRTPYIPKNLRVPCPQCQPRLEIRPYHGMMVVNHPLTRPYFLGGGGIGGVPLDSHDISQVCLLFYENPEAFNQCPVYIFSATSASLGFLILLEHMNTPQKFNSKRASEILL